MSHPSKETLRQETDLWLWLFEPLSLWTTGRPHWPLPAGGGSSHLWHRHRKHALSNPSPEHVSASGAQGRCAGWHLHSLRSGSWQAQGLSFVPVFPVQASQVSAVLKGCQSVQCGHSIVTSILLSPLQYILGSGNWVCGCKAVGEWGMIMKGEVTLNDMSIWEWRGLRNHPPSSVSLVTSILLPSWWSPSQTNTMNVSLSKRFSLPLEQSTVPLTPFWLPGS